MECYVKATFKGLGAELGYKAGQEYELHINCHWQHPYFIIQRINGGGRIPYNNFFTFLQYWSNVTFIP